MSLWKTIVQSPVVATMVALFTGGGIGAFTKYFIDRRESNAEIGQELRDELRAEIESLRTEVDDMRDAFVEERRARINAQFAAFALRKKFNLVVEMLNELRREQGMSEVQINELPGFGIPTLEELRYQMDELEIAEETPDPDLG